MPARRPLLLAPWLLSLVALLAAPLAAQQVPAGGGPPAGGGITPMCTTCGEGVFVSAVLPTNYVPPNGGPYTARFVVANTHTYGVDAAASCSRTGAITCGTVSPSFLSLDPGGHDTVFVQFTAGALSTATLTLTVNHDAQSTNPRNASTSIVALPNINLVLPTLTSGSRAVVARRQPVVRALFTRVSGVTLDTTLTVLKWRGETVTPRARHNRGLLEWEVDSARALAIGDSALVELTICVQVGTCRTTTRWAVLPNDNKPVLGFAGMPLATLGSGFGAPFGPGVGVSQAEVETGISIPAYYSMGVARSAGLVYSTRQSYPRALVLVDLELAWPAGNPGEIRLRLWDGGVTLDSLVLSNPTCATGAVRRCRAVLQGDFAGSAFGTPTRKHLRVEAEVTSGGTSHTNIDSAEVVLVDRRTTPYGSGWWPAGVSQLTAAGGDRLLVGASGATTVYRGNGDSLYLPPPGSFVSLAKVTSGWDLRTRGTLARAGFNSSGRLAALIDHNANADSIRYDGGGKVTHFRDPIGKLITLEYDASAMLMRFKDPADRYSVVSISASSHQLTYDSLSSPSARSIRTTFGYQAYPGSGTVVLVRRAGVIGDTTFVTYDSTFRRRPVQAALPLVRDPVSGVYTAPIVQYTAYERRGVGALVPLDSTWVMITDARGFWSKSLPNRWGQSVRSWDQKGLLGRAAYDPDGFLLWSEGKTADSSRTYHVYDAHRRPVKSYIVRTASDTLRGDSLVYDANHRVVQVIDNRNKTTTTTWDGLGNVIGVKDPNGDSTRTWYLTNGLVDSIKLPGPTPAYRRVRYETVWKQVASTIDPGGDTTGWTWYDALGRAEIGRARLKGDSLAGFRWAQSQTWYGSDNSIDSTATFRASTSSGFAPPTSWPALTDTLNTRRADFRYDRAGRDSLRLNNRGKGPRYAFDRLGRLTHRWPWAEVTTVYDSMRYDLTGNVVGVRTRRGHWITTAFDSRNRDSVRVIPGVGTEVKTYGGPLDQLTGWEITSYVDPIGGLNPKRTWAWDQRGRLLSETSYPTGTARTLSYAYDDKERPFQVTDPLGTWTTEYEANRGMPIKLKTPLGDTLTYTWDARGRPGGLQVASGGTRLNITHTWNGSGALDQRHITWLPTSQTVGKWTRLAAADANPAIATRWHEWKTGSTLDSITAYPVYDGWERLIQWDQIHGAQGDETYAFDRTGNLAPHDESSVTFDPVRDRMLTRGAWTYTYDHGGNLVTATDGSESWEYGYDPLNRLVSARRNSALIARYAYDVTGRRMAKRVYSSASGGTEAYTAFVYRGANVAFDTDSAGTIRWKYVWGAGTDDLVGFQDAAGNHYYAVTDQLGSVRNVLTRSGAWRMRLRYRPYGQHMDSSGAGVALRYRWTGREWDGELKMYFHRARHYDPAMNRFVQEDPIGQAGGENLYAYVGGSPLEATDPSGTEAVFLEKGPGGCAPNCFERGVYLDGIYVKNGFWLAGLPGIGTSIGGRLIDDAWATQGYDYEEYKRGYANAIEDRAANSDDDDTRFMVHDAAMLTSGQFFDLLRALNGRGLLRHGASAHLAAGQVFRMSDIATDYFLGVLGKGFNALSSTVEPITGLPGRFWNLKDVERAHELTHEWVHVYHAIYDECEADMVAAANSRYRGFIAHRCRPNR